LENKCSSICKNDSDCLSNKCVNNFCVFNDETPIEHCDDIYTEPGFLRFRSSYMYCGKAAGDSCKDNNECSSKKCLSNICNTQYKGSNDNEGATTVLSVIFVIIGIIIMFICFMCCCCGDNPK